MNEQQVDKSDWEPGPWMKEPDREQFEHLGLPCLIVRVPGLGHLCGYVAVPPSHPWHGQDFMEIDADVHGGLTYGRKCEGSICHVPAPGEPEDVYWVGFDCAHAFDMSPGTTSMLRRLGHRERFTDFDSYKTIDYVRSEVRRLATQARDAMPES